MLNKSDEELLEDAEEVLLQVFAALDSGDWSIDHTEGCPEDDTCECSAGKTATKASAVLNAITYRLYFARGKRVCLREASPLLAHKVKWLDGVKVVTECALIRPHESYFPIVRERAGVVLSLGHIPSCPRCYPDTQDICIPPGAHNED
jgi:hypothetical protein